MYLEATYVIIFLHHHLSDLPASEAYHFAMFCRPTFRHDFDATSKDATADGEDEHMATASVVTSTTSDTPGALGSTEDHVPSMTVAGIIDRLDRYRSRRAGVWRRSSIGVQ